MSWTEECRPDVRIAVRELDEKGSMSLGDFMSRLLDNNLTLEAAAAAITGGVRSGFIWVGCSRPRRGRADYVTLTGNGRLLINELKRREALQASTCEPAAQSTELQPVAVQPLA